MKNTKLNLPRYVNVDLVVGYSLRSFAFLAVLFVSYDIVCQWLVKFWTRMPDWPKELQLDPLTTKMRGCIPKFHFNAHEAQGHSQFSFHRVPGSADIDGECCERIWDGTNALGKTTRTMGPGMRSDTLDDHFGFWNWKKYTGIGAYFLPSNLYQPLISYCRENAKTTLSFGNLHEKLYEGIARRIHCKYAPRECSEMDFGDYRMGRAY